MILIMMEYDGVCRKIETKENICINAFCYENKLSNLHFRLKTKNSMDLLLIIDESKSNYVYIKDFDKFMFHKTNNENKNYCKSCLQCFSSKNVWNIFRNVLNITKKLF